MKEILSILTTDPRTVARQLGDELEMEAAVKGAKVELSWLGFRVNWQHERERRRLFKEVSEGR